MTYWFVSCFFGDKTNNPFGSEKIGCLNTVLALEEDHFPIIKATKKIENVHKGYRIVVCNFFQVPLATYEEYTGIKTKNTTS